MADWEALSREAALEPGPPRGRCRRAITKRMRRSPNGKGFRHGTARVSMKVGAGSPASGRIRLRQNCAAAAWHTHATTRLPTGLGWPATRTAGAAGEAGLRRGLLLSGRRRDPGGLRRGCGRDCGTAGGCEDRVSGGGDGAGAGVQIWRQDRRGGPEPFPWQVGEQLRCQRANTSSKKLFMRRMARCCLASVARRRQQFRAGLQPFRYGDFRRCHLRSRRTARDQNRDHEPDGG